MIKFPLENCIQRDIDGGAWRINTCGQSLLVIASSGGGWEHVSVSHKKRIPFWREMCKVKDIFWEPEDTVIQFHPPKSQYINYHPRCLHLWRNPDQEIICPPWYLVGPKNH